jgi:hypothetical protein
LGSAADSDPHGPTLIVIGRILIHEDKHREK